MELKYTDRRFCVYLHIGKKSGKVRYVGSGTENRATRVMRRCSDKNHYKTFKEENGFDVLIFTDMLTRQEALEIEYMLIKHPIEKWNLININPNSSIVKELDFDYFNEVLFVDETSPSGLRWKTTKKKTSTQKEHAGTINNRGYWQLNYNGKIYSAHRIVWLLSKGVLDSNKIIHHKDGNRSNNKLCNLEETTQQINNVEKNKHNEYTEVRSHSKTGVKRISKTIGKTCCFEVFDDSNKRIRKINFGKNRTEEEAFELAIKIRNEYLNSK